MEYKCYFGEQNDSPLRWLLLFVNVLLCRYAKKTQQNSELFSAVLLCPPGFLSTSVLLNILLNTVVLSEVSADVSSSPFCLTLACYQAADNRISGQLITRVRQEVRSAGPAQRQVRGPGAPIQPGRERQTRCLFLCESPARGGGAHLTAPAVSAPNPLSSVSQRI